jgi:hypothetical protein
LISTEPVILAARSVLDSLLADDTLILVFWLLHECPAVGPPKIFPKIPPLAVTSRRWDDAEVSCALSWRAIFSCALTSNTTLALMTPFSTTSG